MSARLTMNVSGKIRWANVSRRLLPRAKERVITEANRLNREIVPRGLTGKLQDSFTVEQTEKTLRFYWDVPYAKFVDLGTNESAGRYVPMISKRLVTTQLSPRTQVFREARARGMIGARAVLKVPIKKTREKLPSKGTFYEAGPKGVEAKESAYYTVSTTGELSGTTKGRGIGRIEISRGLTKPLEAKVTRHELAHAAQWRSGRAFPYSPAYDIDITRRLEKEARSIERGAARHGRDIGTHPGIKAQHFSTKMSDALRNTVVQSTKETIHEALR